jgi:hypothetical protein
MGGAIAIDFTLEHPDRVTALVVAASGLGGFEASEEEEDWWASRSAPIDAAIEAGDLERAEDLRLQIWAPLGTEDAAGKLIRDIAFDNIHELTMDESGEEELDPPAALRLGEIDVPTLVMIAEHDPSFMRRTGDLIARGVLDAQRVVIEGADHVVKPAPSPRVRRCAPHVPRRARLRGTDGPGLPRVGRGVRVAGGRSRGVRHARPAEADTTGPPPDVRDGDPLHDVSRARTVRRGVVPDARTRSGFRGRWRGSRSSWVSWCSVGAS